MRKLLALGALATVLVLVLVLGLGGWWREAHRGALVVYCAQDAQNAEKILRDFERRTGQQLDIRYETGAAPARDLTDLLIREKDAPRCDVYWDNELLGMLDLQERGLLVPYRGPGAARIPAAFKAPDGSWTGFAARLRVVIYNTAKIGRTPPNITGLLPGSDVSRLAMAKPLDGATRIHYTLLWQQWGREKLEAWRADWRRGGVQELPDNAAVKEAVAQGNCYAGFTDTDDFFGAKDEGQPVAMTPVRLDDGQTICIPNTVAIIRGTSRLAAARQLTDFLLSEETELALAAAPARQVPLGAVPPEKLSPEVRELATWAREGANLTGLGTARAECLAWLQAQSAP